MSDAKLSAGDITTDLKDHRVHQDWRGIYRPPEGGADPAIELKAFQKDLGPGLHKPLLDRFPNF